MLCMPTPAAFEGQFFILTRFGGIQALTGLIAAAPGTTAPGTCGQRIATTTRPATATTTSGFASRARGLIPEVRSLRTPIPCVGTDQFPKTCAAAMRTKNHRVRRSGRADASNARRTPPPVGPKRMDVLAKGLRLRHSVLVHTRTKGSKDIKRLVKFNFIHENASFNHHNNEHCIVCEGSGEGLRHLTRHSKCRVKCRVK